MRNVYTHAYCLDIHGSAQSRLILVHVDLVEDDLQSQYGLKSQLSYITDGWIRSKDTIYSFTSDTVDIPDIITLQQYLLIPSNT